MSSQPRDAEGATDAPAAALAAQTTISYRGAAWTAEPPLEPVTVPGYEILGELGRGGMGVVYKARQVGLDRVVALKMILAGGHAGEAALARFKTEAEAVARLQHPNIVQIFEVGEHGGLPFFSLEFCGGGGLNRKLAGTPLPPGEGAALLEKLARAVQSAHDKGVVHRDLKPANVLLTEDGTPKITDFGLAKKLDDEAGQTRTGAVMGTPSYMAPEQAAGRTQELGPACDVYALGAVLYECLTGRPPFRAATALETLKQVLSDEPAPPRRLQSGTPRDLETVCLKCLQKQPDRRYATARELAEDLCRFQASEPVRARAVGPVGRAARWVRRRPASAAAYGLLLAALVLGVGGGGATWLWLGSEKARGEAIKAQGDAEAARRRAETAEGEAKQARDDLKGALLREQEAKRQLTQVSYADRIGLAQHEWDAGSITHTRQLLDEAGTLQDALTPGHRPWEWGYLDRVFHPELAVMKGHAGGVMSVAFSPDGRRVATASLDHTARLWDAESGKQLAVLEGHTGAVESVAFSPDGRRLATASVDHTARLWDAESGKSLAVLVGHTDVLWRVAFSPDGRRVATASWDHTARLWDAESGKPLAALQGHTAKVLSAAFSPDGRRLATASVDHTARLWDAESGKSLAVLEGHTDIVDFVAFSPDGGRLATASYDGTARLWDAESGKQLAALEGHTDIVGFVAFSPDGGRLATGTVPGGSDRSARLWDATSGKPIAVLQGHPGPVVSLAFSPDGGRLATAGYDGTARLWDVACGKPFTVPDTRRSGVVALGFDAGLVSSIGAVLEGHTAAVNSVAFSPDGRRVATASEDKTARLWDAASGKQLALEGHTDKVASVAFSPDGRRVVTGCADGTARLWDAESGKPLAVLRGHTAAVNSVAFSPDGRRVATACSDRTARLWDAESGKQLIVFQGHTGALWSVAFSPDGGRLATASEDRTARLWDAESGKQLAVLEGHTDFVMSVAFSPDGGRVATGDYGGVGALWDAASGKLLVALQGHTGEVRSVAFSPDSDRVATASDDGTARLWDVESGKTLAVLRGHTFALRSVAFSPDGGRLATASFDGTVRMWIARESPEDVEKRRRFWREQQADAAEKEGRWFAARFHLNRLLADDPNNAYLLRRRDKAEALLKTPEPEPVDEEASDLKKSPVVRLDPVGADAKVLAFGDSGWSDYDVELQAQAIDANGEFGVCFRAAGDRQLIAVFGGWKNTNHAVLAQKPEKKEFALATNSVSGRIEHGRWYRVRIEARAAHFRIFFGGRKLFDFEAPGFDRGGIALRAQDGPAIFRNIKVTDPEGKTLYEGVP